MKKKFLPLSVMALLTMCLISSCGTARTSVRVSNSADGTTTTISVTGTDGGATSVNVTPTINQTK